jgi:hypothetical protein
MSIWQPVYIDEQTPYIFPSGALSAVVDYVVFDQYGKVIRQGKLEVVRTTSSINVIDEADVDQSEIADIKFRFASSPQGLIFQYWNNRNETCVLRFKTNLILGG